MDNLVFSNMLHRPARTVVSVLGIAIGVLLIVFTYGMTQGSLRDQGSRAANVGAEIIFGSTGGGILSTEMLSLPVSISDEIKNVEGVERVVLIGQNSVKATDKRTGSNTGNRLIDGITYKDYSEVVGIKIINGRPFNETADEVLVDTAFQRQKKLKIGDKFPIYERDFTIVGTYEPAAGARVKIPLAVMQTQLGGEGKVSSFLVKLKKGFEPNDVARRLQEKFPDNRILLTSQIEELYMQGFPALNIFLNVIIGIAAVISALVILLTMYTTVTERTRQIGIMKSLGMSNAQIAWVITKEALLLSFCGILGGIILSVLLRFVLTQFITLEVEINPLVLLITAVIGLVGGALGALYPALKAARLDAVDALNYD